MASADEFAELVWENGQILMRGRSDYSDNPRPEADSSDGVDKYPRKRPRLGTMKYELGLSGHQEFADKERSLQDLDHEFSGFMESSRFGAHDKYIIEPQTVPVCRAENPRLANASGVEIPQLARATNDEPYHSSSLHECQVPAHFTRSVMSRSQNLSTDELPDSISQRLKSSGPDKHLGLRNFSLFLRRGQPQLATGVLAGDPSSSRVPDLMRNDENVPGDLVVPETGLENAKESYEVLNLAARKLDQIQHIASRPKEPLPDEQSEAPVHRSDSKNNRTSSLELNTTRRKSETRKSSDQGAAATSRSSRGASNDISHFSSMRKHEHLDQEMASPSENADDEKEEAPKSLAGVRGGAKKKRTSQVHNLSERKRRAKINKKMRALQTLVPNSSKTDKASMLDDAIKYLKTLQFQLQILSMGSSLGMPPMMMPTAVQQMQAPYLSPMYIGMGMKIPMGLSPFSNSAMLGLAASHVLPMPVASQPPFFPFIRGSSSSTPPIPAVTPFPGAAAAPVELMGSRNQESFQDTRQSRNH